MIEHCLDRVFLKKKWWKCVKHVWRACRLIFIFFFLIFPFLVLQHLIFSILSHIYSLLSPCRALHTWIKLFKPHNNFMRWLLIKLLPPIKVIETEACEKQFTQGKLWCELRPSEPRARGPNGCQVLLPVWEKWGMRLEGENWPDSRGRTWSCRLRGNNRKLSSRAVTFWKLACEES